MPTHFDAQIAFLGIVVQTISAALLAVTFVALRRIAPGRAYLRDWTHAFLALTVALVGVLLRYQLAPQPLEPNWSDPPLLRALLDTIYQGGKFAFFALLLVGARRFAGRESPIRPRFAAVGLAVLAIVSAVALVQLNTAVTAQSPIAILASVLAAREMIRAPKAKQSLGSRASAAVFVLLGLLWCFYLGSFVWLQGQAQHYPALVTLLARYNSFVDVLLQSALGFALVTTLFQDLEREAEAARAERAELQSRLAVAQKLEALGVLVSGVAHELNNPLTSILGYSDVLSVDPRLPADLREPLHTIREQAQRCRTIVRSLLDAARQQRAPRVAIRLADLVARVVRGFAPQLAAARISVANELPRDGTEVQADPTGLEQVFSNLVANALDALPAGGRIRISAEPGPPDRLRLRFEDDGPGIPQELRARIFEPFFTTKGGRRGTGLGLAISQRIVQAHGGTMSLAPSADGGSGAAFEIELPFRHAVGSDSGQFPVPADAAITRSPAPGESDPPTDVVGKPRVLVVDDEKSVRELLHRFLRLRGFSVRLAADGNEALALLAGDTRIDALVTDLRMPGLNGVELFDAVLARWPELASRTIAITGDALSPEFANFVRRRACLVLEKPLDLARLAAELAARVAELSESPQEPPAATRDRAG